MAFTVALDALPKAFGTSFQIASMFVWIADFCSAIGTANFLEIEASSDHLLASFINFLMASP